MEINPNAALAARRQIRIEARCAHPVRLACAFS